MLISLELALTRGFQRAVIVWLTIFSTGSGALSVLVPYWNKLTIKHMLLLSLGNFVLFVVVLIVSFLPYSFSLSPSDRYIRDHHADISQKAYPARGLWRNSVATIGFAFGWLDDGENGALQLIKERVRRMVLLQFWVLALMFMPVPIVFLSSVVKRLA